MQLLALAEVVTLPLVTVDEAHVFTDSAHSGRLIVLCLEGAASEAPADTLGESLRTTAMGTRPPRHCVPEHLLARKLFCCRSSRAVASRTVTDGRGRKRFSATQEDRLTRVWPSQWARPAPACPSSLPSAPPEDRGTAGRGGSSPGPCVSRSPPGTRPPQPHPRPCSLVRPARLLLRTSRKRIYREENMHENTPACSRIPVTHAHTQQVTGPARPAACPGDLPTSASGSSGHSFWPHPPLKQESCNEPPPNRESIRLNRTIHWETARQKDLEAQ